MLDCCSIQLFREKLSEKVHATVPKGIVGGFKFTVLERNLKELVRKAVEMCLRVLKNSNKSRFDRYSRQKQYWSYPMLTPSGYRVHIFPTSVLEIAVYLYGAFSHDVTAAILVFRNKKTAAMLMFQTNPVKVELFSYVNPFFCSHKFA